MPHKLWLSGDGKYLVACGGIPSSFVWDASTGKLIQTVVGDSVTALSPDGDRLLIHQWQSPVYEEWELNGPRKLRQFNAQRKDFVHHVYYVNASRIVAATAAGAEIWEVPSPPVAKPTAEKLAEWAKSRYSIPVTRSLAGHSKLPLKLVFSRDGSRLLSASEDGTLRYWNTASAESLVTLNGHKGAVTCCALSADGKQALSGGLDDIVRWWDLEAGTQLAEFKGHGAAIYAVAFDAGSNEAVSVSANNTICRWSLAEKNEASRFTASQIRGYGGPKDVVNLLGGSFTPDAKHVLVPGYFGTIHLLDTKSQTEAGKFGAWGFRDMTFSEDGTLMACTSEHSLSVWDVATKTQKVELQGKNGGQRGVAFTRDGKRLIVGANNQPTRVWDIESKAVIGELSTKANGWSAIAASPDGQWAASGGDNGKILLWPLSWLTE